MDDEFQIFYPVIIEIQEDFEGHEHINEVFCEGHILHGGRLLCGEAKEAVKNRVGAKKEKIVEKWKRGTKIHPECQRKYMKNGHSAWTAWVEGKPIPAYGKETPVKY